jgi:hypothetical protein
LFQKYFPIYYGRAFRQSLTATNLISVDFIY